MCFASVSFCSTHVEYTEVHNLYPCRLCSKQIYHTHLLSLVSTQRAAILPISPTNQDDRPSSDKTASMATMTETKAPPATETFHFINDPAGRIAPLQLHPSHLHTSTPSLTPSLRRNKRSLDRPNQPPPLLPLLRPNPQNPLQKRPTHFPLDSRNNHRLQRRRPRAHVRRLRRPRFPLRLREREHLRFADRGADLRGHPHVSAPRRRRQQQREQRHAGRVWQLHGGHP